MQENQIFKPFDEAQSIDHLPDPVRTLCDIAQAQGSVLKGRGTTFSGVTLPNYFGHFGERDSYAVFSFNAAQRVLRDAGRFSSDYWEDTNVRVQGRSLFTMDPPEHSRFRGLIQKGFMPRMVGRWEDEIIRPLIAAAFDRIKANGRADLARDLNVSFPYQVICRILGFPTTNEDFVSDRITKMTRGVYELDNALAAVAELKDYIQPFLEERRRHPQDDFLSALIMAELDGSRLSDDEIMRFILHLYPAGMETTFRGVSNLMLLLLTNQDQFESVRRNRSLIPAAIQEMLRVEGPVPMFARLVKMDTEIDGVEVPAKAMVYVMHAVANRDPSRWKNPHEFDVTREMKSNIGYGYGPHVCIGMHLANREMAIYLEHVLNDLPNVRIDPERSEPPRIEGWTLRSVLSLPVVWDA